MANFLKSTISNLFQSARVGAQGNRKSSNISCRQPKLSEDEFDDFISRKLEIGDYSLIVKKKIGTGGFSSVYMANQMTTSANQQAFAIKRMLVDDNDEQKERIAKECRLWKSCSGNSASVYVVKFILCAELKEKSKSYTEYLLLSEYCDFGQLSDYIRTDNTSKFNTVQTMHILFQQTTALNYLHQKQSPPIVHRDIKLENFLVTSYNNRIILKLCDFGSATDQQIQPTKDWTALYRGLVEDEFQTATTPAYRPPEILNTYDDNLIGCPMDMWALGCCLYQEAFCLPHPFLDCSKLKILNADFKLPNNYDLNIGDIIGRLLKSDPLDRITAASLLHLLHQKDLVPNNAADTSNLKFIFFSSSLLQVDPSAVIRLTSKLSLLTSVTCPSIRSSCFIINTIIMSYIWLKNSLPLEIIHKLQHPYSSVLLHSPIFGHTLVAAASLFKHSNLCTQSELFIRFLSNTIGNISSLQMELPSSAQRYLNYMFDIPLHCKRMLIKQLEILPGNDPFTAYVFQIDDNNGNNILVYKSNVSCDWQRDVNCTVFGDVLIRLVSSERTAEIQFNTMFIPVTECEICFESCDFDSHPFGDCWIESLIVDFMFTIEDAIDNFEDTVSIQSIPAYLIVCDDRELRAIQQSFTKAAQCQSKFFTSCTSQNYSLRSDVVHPLLSHNKSNFESHICEDTFKAFDNRSLKSSGEEKEHKIDDGDDLLLNVDDASPLIDLNVNDNEKTANSSQNNSLPEYLFSSYLHYFGQPDDTTEIKDYSCKNVDKAKSEETVFLGKHDASNKDRNKSKAAGGDLFGDLFENKSKPKMSLIDLQRLKQEREQKEPIALKKIREWSHLYNKDILLLLSHLHSVLPMESSWIPVSLTANTKSNEIKKYYRKAVLLVHPDKNTAKHLPNEQKEVCRLIFIELSEAWTRFQSSARF